LKGSPQNGRKIFACNTSDKGLITRIYRLLKELNSPKINDPMKKWVNELNRAFFQRKKSKRLKKHMQKCSTFVGIKDANQNHIKIPPYSSYNSYHQEHKQMLARMWGKKESSYTTCGNVN
jgi:hypothetical protein